MKYLVDANVLSEATRPEPTPSVLVWLREHESDLVVSPIVLGEIEYGILLSPIGRKRTKLQQWFAAGVSRLNVVDLDVGTATVWATLLARLKRKGRAMPIKDSLIAASALQHDLTVVTRNRGDFQHAGVRLIDPFQA
jgi:predicted nucleic acid-binding protein